MVSRCGFVLSRLVAIVQSDTYERSRRPWIFIHFVNRFAIYMGSNYDPVWRLSISGFAGQRMVAAVALVARGNGFHFMFLLDNFQHVLL